MDAQPAAVPVSSKFNEAKARFGQVIEQLQKMQRLGILAPMDEEWIGKAEAGRAALD